MKAKRIFTLLITSFLLCSCGNVSGPNNSVGDDPSTEINGNKNYVVTFLNYDSSVLFTTSVKPGGTAVYQGETPSRPKSENYIYEFVGWSESLENVIGNMTIVAQYDMKDRYYKVDFKNYDATLLYSQTVEYGQTAYYYGSTPRRESSNEKHYSFSGWDVSLDNIKVNTTATAQYSESTRYYTVTFKNYDGSLLGTEQVEYNGSVTWSKSNPVRPADEQYSSYTFTGWDSSLDNIKADCIRTAVYEHGDLQKYTVKFMNYDGTSIIETKTVDYGTSVTYTGATPTKPMTAQYSYSFNGNWDTSGKSLSFVKSNIVAIPQFNSSVNQYTVTFEDGAGNILSSKTVDYGSSVTYTGSEPQKESEDENSYYVFKGWSSNTSSVIEDMTVTPVFEKHMKFIKVAAGNNHFLAITKDRKVFAWGSNSYGQFGNGMMNSQYVSEPVEIVGYSGKASECYAGGNTSAVITNLDSSYKDDISLYMWGSSSYGQCANNTYDQNIVVPTKVNKAISNSGYRWKTIAIGGSHTIGICGGDTVESLYGWGYASDGQIAKAGNTWVKNPASMGATNIGSQVSVFAKGSSSAYLTSDGTGYGDLFVTGRNSYGQVGSGSTSTVKEFTKVLSSVSKFSMSGNHCVAIGDYGQSLYCWGYNTYGQLGNGGNSNTYIPTKVSTSFDVSDVKCVNDSTIIRSVNGDYYAVGRNYFNAYGNASKLTEFTKVFDNVGGIQAIDGNSKELVLITNDNKLISYSDSGMRYI